MCGSLERQFAVKTPCGNCPFRADEAAIELAPGRIESIVSDLVTQRASGFHCHKKVHAKGGRNHDDDGNYTPTDIAHCAGATALIQKLGRNPQAVELAIRLGIIAPEHYQDGHAGTIEPTELNMKTLDPLARRMVEQKAVSGQ